ncbi:DUF4148 domain-containing protein [Comamonas guangdongensis]|uniref:DUF4148 domain-containing protein n=1 Tax=Comamonas guangdongensis TaxID=510515 RepID=A0ABV3ZW04_9BURK
MTQNRFFPSSLIAGLAASAALILPGAAMADSYWHPANNEAGVKTYPEHFRSSKTRGQVRAEAETALRQGGASRFNSGAYPADVPQAVSGRSRQEVVQELLNETPAQREARQRAFGG